MDKHRPQTLPTHERTPAPYQMNRYSEGEKREEFKRWATDALKHIRTCEFKDLVNYPDAPTEDVPDTWQASLNQ